MKVILLSLLLVVSVYGGPYQPFAAEVCNENECLISNGCRCSTATNPIDNPDDPAPQLLAITISESIVQTLYDNYIIPLFGSDEYINPDGIPISISLYVNHQYTDYSLVQDLYNRGFEIGVHSITKTASQDYWRNASLNDLIEEFDGQRRIIAKFANIPIEDLTGARTPQLQIEGDVTMEAYAAAGLTYDQSWPEASTEKILPYSLDYASKQSCLATLSCPTESHPGMWIAPITNILGEDGQRECNSLATCNVTGSAEQIAQWLLDQVDSYRQINRAPMVLRLDSYWFDFTPNTLDAFKIFLDRVTQDGEIFLVPVSGILEWIKNPVPFSQYQSPYNPRDQGCQRVTCNLLDDANVPQTMVSCVPCPDVYPWKGNPDGVLQKKN